MLTQADFEKKYGKPYESAASQKEFERKWMVLYKYPSVITSNIPCLGMSIYIHRDFQQIYEKFLLTLIERGLHKEIKENDQCFCIRRVRGASNWSVHTWGCGVDLNPEQNPLGFSRQQAIDKGLYPFSNEFQNVARECGLIAGIDFTRRDGMHFQIKTL